MVQEKKGFIARMLEGKERSEEYARSTLPTNRWQLFFDIFKGNFLNPYVPSKQFLNFNAYLVRGNGWRATYRIRF